MTFGNSALLAHISQLHAEYTTLSSSSIFNTYLVLDKLKATVFSLSWWESLSQFVLVAMQQKVKKNPQLLFVKGALVAITVNNIISLRLGISPQ